MQLLGPRRQSQLVSLFFPLPTSASPTGSVGLPPDLAETHPFLGCLLLLVDTDSESRANMAPHCAHRCSVFTFLWDRSSLVVPKLAPSEGRLMRPEQFPHTEYDIPFPGDDSMTDSPRVLSFMMDSWPENPPHPPAAP